MKCPYLFLAVLCTLLTCEGQRSNNDIIWYPVDDEEGVFISVYGEKYRGRDGRNAQMTKWRSHRHARFSGMEQNPIQALPLSYDPTENQDPSFFHNINERRPGIISQIPPFSDFQESRKKKPHKKPPGHENNLQEILNEVFEYNNPASSSQGPGSNIPYPGQTPTNQWASTQGLYPGQRPTTGNQWGGRPQTGNQWSANLQQSTTTNQWGGSPQRPATGNQWGSLVTEFPGTRPVTNTNQPQTGNNQWGTSGIFGGNQNEWGSSRPGQRPNSWATTMGNTNRPSKPEGSDILVFPDDTTRFVDGTSRLTTTTPSDLGPTDAPTMSPCERLCPVTPEFNPVCGSDGKTYTNLGRLKCSQMCGKDVSLSHHGNCGRTTLVTPLVSNNQRKKIRGFFLFK